ncbi:hypothetical protein NDU88_003704 [Pleurodeles waltl]|uniref:Uncharacterized protein n=1 Tax=Pleurodeles waltl TaxID=8319 RepID=A0AAV7SGS2_PLEWA|nr:hypothetical protein NDU88_003704 [Pleurodeles waltl]
MGFFGDGLASAQSFILTTAPPVHLDAVYSLPDRLTLQKQSGEGNKLPFIVRVFTSAFSKERGRPVGLLQPCASRCRSHLGRSAGSGQTAEPRGASGGPALPPSEAPWSRWWMECGRGPLEMARLPSPWQRRLRVRYACAMARARR